MNIRIAKNNMTNVHITNNGTIETSANYDTTETSANRDLSDSSSLASLVRYPSLPNKLLSALLAILLAFLCVTPLAGCTSKTDYGQYTAEPGSEYQTAQNDSADSESSSASSSSSGSATNSSNSSASASSSTTEGAVSVSAEQGEQPSLAEIPEFEGEPYIEVNYNEPSFTEEEKSSSSFESYSDLDYEGRCGTAFALVGEETMPTEKRESISEVKPTGWQSVRYDFVEGESLYNRCHLLGFQLTGENANEENLITGTRYLNTEGMLPFKDEIDSYVDETNNHVLYRVTPLFYEDELVARGVHMEAYSVEDEGAGVSFNVYCYNVQPGVGIDYETGNDWKDPSTADFDDKPSQHSSINKGQNKGQNQDQNLNQYQSQNQSSNQAQDNHQSSSANQAQDYVLNTNSKKFHYPWCDSVTTMSNRNKETFYGTREDLVNEGYEPCGACNP